MKRIYKILIGLLVLGLIGGANYGVYQLPDWKIDLSANKINSLANFTKKIINGIDGQVEVKVYASSNLPGEIRPTFNSLKSILKSMELVNKNKFKLAIVDPTGSEQAKSEVVKYGIQALQFSSIKSDKFEVQQGYFGLVISYKDKNETLPVAGDVGNLEYLITSGLVRLTSKSLPTIAVAEDGGTAFSSQIQYLRKFLERSYIVVDVELDGDKAFPEEANGLVIVGRSKKIDDKGIGKVKKWIDSGKATIMLLDRVDVNQGMVAKKNEESGLEKIVADYGMKLGEGLVTSRNGAVASFNTNSGNFLVRYPYWLQIPSSQIDNSNPVFSGINALLLPWASPMELSGEAKPLFWSEDTALVDDNLSDISPTSNKTSTGNTRKYILAGMRSDKIRLAVVGDKDFITDQFVTNSQQNLAVTLNLVDYLSGDSGLFEIRNKVMINSPIQPIDDGKRQVIKYGNMAAPILLLALLYWLTARRRSNRLKLINF